MLGIFPVLAAFTHAFVGKVSGDMEEKESLDYVYKVPLSLSSVCPQLFALDCLPSTVCPETNPGSGLRLQKDGDIRWTTYNVVVYPLACVVAGICAGLLGVGGGLVQVRCSHSSTSPPTPPSTHLRAILKCLEGWRVGCSKNSSLS